MNWKRVNLLDISSPKQWKNLPMTELTEEGYLVYGANGVIGKYPEYTHEFPTLAITCRGATCGSLHITEPKSYINSNAMALDELSPSVHLKFLYYALQKRGFNDVISGSAQPQITREGLSKVFIDIPDLPDQIKIATVLSKAEAIIKQRKENIDLLDEFLKSTFLKMFGDAVRNEKNWDKKKIGDVCKVTKLAGFEYTKYIKYQDEGEIIVVRGLNVKEGKIKLHELKYIDKATSDFLIRSKLFKGDVVITYIGINIGDVAIVEEDNKYHLAPNVAKITANSFYEINPTYLLHFLMYNRRLFAKYTTNTAKQALNMGNIREVEILIPDNKLQKQFELIAQKVDALKEQLKNGLSDLENLYGSLSQRAFKGELDLSGLVIDHIIPVSKGGSDSQDNLQAISKKENIKKADKLPKELKEDKRFGDPFEVDEETAKKQGGWFYKEWKKLHAPKKKSKITWDRVSTEQVANWIKENYTGYHFTSEMLIRFLTDEHVTFPDYYSSEELKKNPRANDADDLKTLIFSSLNNENPFLKLEQVFYNPELDNVNLTLRDEDFELIKNRTRQERTGVYLRIAK